MGWLPAHLQGSRNAGGVDHHLGPPHRRSRCTRWSLNNGAARRLDSLSPGGLLPQQLDEVDTADQQSDPLRRWPAWTIALLILDIGSGAMRASSLAR